MNRNLPGRFFLKLEYVFVRLTTGLAYPRKYVHHSDWLECLNNVRPCPYLELYCCSAKDMLKISMVSRGYWKSVLNLNLQKENSTKKEISLSIIHLSSFHPLIHPSSAWSTINLFQVIPVGLDSSSILAKHCYDPLYAKIHSWQHWEWGRMSRVATSLSYSNVTTGDYKQEANLRATENNKRLKT